MTSWFTPVTGQTCATVAQALALELSLQPEQAKRVLAAVRPLAVATEADLSFLDNPKYKDEARHTKAAAVFIKPEFAELLPKTTVALVTHQPYVAFAKALALFYPQASNRWGRGGIHPTAVVEAGAVVAKTASIGAGSYIGAGVKIGEHVSIAPNVTIVNAEIGDYTIIHPGVRIGQDGFGFAFDGVEKTLVKVPQVGGVKIGRFVEIGANTTIDCGAMADTSIGDMTKIDNQVQIGHNVQIGRMCQIVAQTGIAGSAKLGDGVVVGGQSGIAGHLEVASGVMVAGRSGITKTISQKGLAVGGFPAIPLQEWRKMQVKLARMLKKGESDAAR